MNALSAHLATGATHLCHCWAVTRSDGVTLGFTDHDLALTFDGIRFAPETGLSARALASTTGLSVNNTDAVGALSSDAINEADITAGRYDGAQVRVWLVRWDDVTQRDLRFAGSLGEITRAAGGFQAELRGLTEGLNQPQGRSYLTQCSAVLGDARCRFDLDDPAYRFTAQPLAVEDGRVFRFAQPAFNDAWFDDGQVLVTTGSAQGLRGTIKTDRLVAGIREIILWDPIRASVSVSDTLMVTAGCDKAAQTCRVKFANLVNFQGFPDIPGEDWLVAIPRSDGNLTGSSRRAT
ncbi:MULTISPECIES: DUF2163 domain-containing protein [unclassified Yoonia]|uniref:DUF2163 domain-containing protein n=1 Tax=unclassified Yoonia TaxID=2629118 RepID=UPI002AFE82CF|nr:MULTISPECIES: DUF2163 domain-containing protein [unclassified Yoonia]